MFFHLDMLFKWLIRFRLKHNNLSRYLHEKCFLMTYKSVNKYFDFIIHISYFSFSHFFSVSGRFFFSIRILVWKFYLNKASGELLDPDHYTRARNNPQIPPQALGKIFFFLSFIKWKYFLLLGLHILRPIYWNLFLCFIPSVSTGHCDYFLTNNVNS